jgi:hypothetical protein
MFRYLTWLGSSCLSDVADCHRLFHFTPAMADVAGEEVLSGENAVYFLALSLPSY